MATEDELTGLAVGADCVIEYTDADNRDMTGWTVVLDIRKTDTSSTALVTKTGVESGTYSATPASNTQKFTFTITDDDVASTVIKGDDPRLRYSIWRTDAGFKQPLRYGTVHFNRTTRT